MHRLEGGRGGRRGAGKDEVHNKSSREARRNKRGEGDPKEFKEEGAKGGEEV